MDAGMIITQVLILVTIVGMLFGLSLAARVLNGYSALPRKRKARSAVASRPDDDCYWHQVSDRWPLYNSDTRYADRRLNCDI